MSEQRQRTAVTVRDARDGDVEAITRIQNALITSTTIDWTDEPFSVADRRDWLRAQRAAGRPVLVAEVGGEDGGVAGDDGGEAAEVGRDAGGDRGEVVAFASYGEFRDVERWPGYRYTAEHTVHVDRDHWGGGVGRLLMEELCARAAAAGVHALVAAVDGDNEPSIRFHERVGFHLAGRLPEVGWGHGRWLDLVLLVRVLAPTPAPDPQLDVP